MVINAKKSNILSISKKDKTLYDYYVEATTIPRQSIVRDLGVLISDNLSFEDHIDLIISKASQRLGFIGRSTKGFNPSTLSCLFKSLVVPVLTTSSVIWRPSAQSRIGDLERIQRKFLRSLSFLS